MALATFGAGCFWSTEKSFRKEFGKKLISGLVTRLQMIEKIMLKYSKSPSNHDRATQYRSMIFTHTKDQQEITERIRDQLQTSDMFIGQIITQIQPIDGWKFSIAEAKHQNYLDNKYGWLMCS